MPVLPGVTVIWLGMLVYGLLAGFENIGVSFFVIQGALALAVMGVDFLFTAIGSRYFGGSKVAPWGAAAGLFVGLLFFPIGLLIGPFLGTVAAELLFGRRSEQAVRSGIGATAGFWVALPMKFALEATMIIWFIIRVF